MARLKLEDLNDVLRPEEVARFLHVSRSHVYDLIRDGKLRRVANLGGVVRIPKREIERMLGGEKTT